MRIKSVKITHFGSKQQLLDTALQAYESCHYGKAALIWRKLADKGNSEAQWRLGMLYHYGNGVPKDFKSACKWYKLSAEAKNPFGKYYYGFCVFYGDGVDKDRDEATKYLRSSLPGLKKLALKGNKYAQNSVGVCYEIVEQKPGEAKRWYKMAEKQNHKAAQYNLALVYEKNRNIPKATYWYTKSAESGYVDSQTQLGVLLEEQSQPQQALFWFTKASLHGHSEAQYRLGVCYEYGRATDMSIEQAVYWYEQAAVQNHPKALFRLASIYEQDNQTLDRAISCYEKLLDLGNTEAGAPLARIKTRMTYTEKPLGIITPMIGLIDG